MLLWYPPFFVGGAGGREIGGEGSSTKHHNSLRSYCPSLLPHFKMWKLPVTQQHILFHPATNLQKCGLVLPMPTQSKKQLSFQVKWLLFQCYHIINLPFHRIITTTTKKPRQLNQNPKIQYKVFSMGFLSLLFALFHHKVASHFPATQQYLHKLPSSPRG